MLVKVGEPFPVTHYVERMLSIAPLSHDEIKDVWRTEIDITSCGDNDRVFLPGPVSVHLCAGGTRHLSARSYSLALSGGGEFYELEQYGVCGPQTESEAKESEAKESDDLDGCDYYS